ncbi:MAG TPA: aromatic amino acid lyase, partial [Bdellovibrionota bacterium]|nr:aromatic amino acid lyase [Bdellovibrionota bacterium]
MEAEIEIGIAPLTPEQLRDVADGSRKVRIPAAARERIQNGRRTVEKMIDRNDRPVYSINTGFGSLKNVRIPKDKLDQLQLNIIRSHSVGVGDPLPKSVVRGMMLLRAHSLATGHSGV